MDRLKPFDNYVVWRGFTWPVTAKTLDKFNLENGQQVDKQTLNAIQDWERKHAE